MPLDDLDILPCFDCVESDFVNFWTEQIALNVCIWPVICSLDRIYGALFCQSYQAAGR